MTNTKRIRRAYICSFCGKNQDEVRRLIAGPGGVYICNECIELVNERNAERQKESSSVRGKARCSFCGKKQQQVAYIHAGPNGVNICGECIDLCREILDEEPGSRKV